MRTDIPKPAHLDPIYGAQFQDRSVARAYSLRPPYPPAAFGMLGGLQPPGLQWILELGCGTGDLTFGLLGRADRIDAIEPSSEMLSVAQGRAGADDPRIRWIQATAEKAKFNGPYSLAVAAESLHWMDWSVVLPKVAVELGRGAYLAIVERGEEHLPWSTELRQLISKYSTNRDFRPYDLVHELTIRGLFREIDRRTTPPAPFAQSITDHIELMHSRNGFSRDRMTAGSAAEFDQLYRELLEKHCADGVVRVDTTAAVVWGIPVTA